MMKIPGRFAAAFDERTRPKSCESSGSEHSEDLSDLVNSFLEREIGEREYEFVKEWDDEEKDKETISPDSESLGILTDLFDHENDAVKRSIHAEVDKAYKEVGGRTESASPELKRLLMARLRRRGFDAGICKSKWEKRGHSLSGNYEYIDINWCGNRYIVEVFLAGEFSIARPTVGYSSLLQKIPRLYVGKPEELRQVVKVMCNAIRRSMRSVHVYLPPWRRHTYMHSKWFGSYKRTTNEIPSLKASNDEVVELVGKERESFVPEQGFSLFCKEDFVARRGVGMENLAGKIREIMI